MGPNTTLANGTAGVSYGPTTFTASGSAATPYTYEITSGLPSGSGLSINSSTGDLSGTPLQAGSFIMTVTATDTNGCSGGRSYALDIAVGNQTINFTSTAPAAASVGGPTYNVTATATSGLPVTFTIDATASSVCSIAGSTVSFTAIGTCVIDANQAGNASFNAAPQVQQSFAVGIGSQNITFTSTPPTSPTVGGPTYNVTATGGGSGNPVTFTIDATATSICSIAGSTVSFIAVGTCVIDANQAGNANYNAAPQAMQSFAIGKGNQTISYTSTAPATATVGGATYDVTATATSGLPVMFTIDASAASICSIAGAIVSFTAVGTCVIDANQTGDTNWNAAPQAQQSFSVGKGSQTISFTSTAPAAATVGGTTYNVTATATSGLPVAFTIDATATSICSIAGSTVSFTAVGTCVIDANQAGNANYTAAPQVQQSFAVGQGSQTISFTSTAPSSASVGGATYNVTATATSGLPVTLTIDATAASVCSISGSTVSFTASGTCVIDANQAGNANYAAAPQAQQSFGVSLGAQAIVFTSTPPANAKVGGTTYNVTATGGASGNPVVFTIDATASSICSIAGSTVSFTAVGTCVIDANQAGNANYNAAPQVQQSFGVAMGDQTITFTSTAPASATVGGATYDVTATATSGLTVTFTIDATATSICSITGSTVSFTAVGTCVIDADQAGDANWNAAPQAQQSFTVGQGSQTISFTSTAPASAKVGGATYTVTATATSGLPVTLTIDATATSICSIAGNVVSFTAVGTCKIDANQAGNANYLPAPQAQQTFAVAKGDQTITFTSTAPSNAQVNGATYNVTATATSGLAVTFTIDATATSICSIVGNTVSFNAGGTCVIDANQAGNTNYNAAPQAQQSFFVAKLDQTITFTSTAPAGAKVGGATYNVTATASSGLTVTFSAGSTACNVAGSTVSFVHATTCTINADQAGNAQYNAAPQAQQSFAVAKGDQTISFSTTQPAFGSASASATPHTYNPAATATSTLAVTFSTSGACSFASPTVTFGPGAGACTINADQAGNADWNAAPQVQQSTTVEIPANADNDSNTVTGNVAINVLVGSANNVLTGDTGTAIAIRSYGSPNGTEQTSIGTATATAQGGSVTLNANGSYSYDPPANFTGTDTFKYIIGNDLTATSTGTVTLTVSDRIIVVASGASGNCKPITPTPCSLSAADALAAPTGVDLVFVESGSYSNPNAAIALNANQKLVGNFVSLSQAITDAGITLAPESVTLATIAASTTPTLSNNASVITLGGGNLVEYFSITNSAGSAVLGNAAGSGTSTIKSITVTDAANAGNGVNITANLGTLNFSNISITTTSGAAFAATGGSTVNATQNNTTVVNTLSSTTGTALSINGATIGASNLTFRSISANGGANGIVLLNTGATGHLAVTGNASAGSGGSLTGMAGADLATNNCGSLGAAIPAGVGIYLNNTTSPSFAYMTFPGTFGNFGILGYNVNGFTLDNTTMTGTYGDNVNVDEDTIHFCTLTGSATISNSTISNGAETNLRIVNASGTLNRLTLQSDTFGLNQNGGGGGTLVEADGGTTNVTVLDSTFLGSRGTPFDALSQTGATMDLVFGQPGHGNTIHNTHPNIVPFAQDLAVTPSGTETFDINSNHFDSASAVQAQGGVIINAALGTATATGYFRNNTIGNSGVANSGSSGNDPALDIESNGGGDLTIKVDNNQIFQFGSNGAGVLVQAGATGGNPTAVNVTFTNNSIAQPGTFAVANNAQGFQLNNGTTSGENFTTCLDFSGNTANGSGTGPGGDLRFRQRFDTKVNLPGYTGASSGTGGPPNVVSYIQGLNPTGPPSVTSISSTAAGGGFFNTASCALPPFP